MPVDKHGRPMKRRAFPRKPVYIIGILLMALAAIGFLVMMILGIVASTPVWKILSAKFAASRCGKYMHEPVAMAFSIAVLVLALMAIASDSYNPFIYFRF